MGITGGGGSGTVSSGSQGQFAFYNAGGTTVTATSSLFLAQSGFIGIGTTTPGSLFSINNIANFTTATSTYYGSGGINISGGCFSINGACVGGTGGTNYWTFASGNLYNNSGTSVGIGTTTPWAMLSINPSGITGPAFAIGSSTATSFIVTSGGRVSIGTTSPFKTLAVNGTSYFTDSLTAPIVDNGGQAVNVLAYGAKNDGTGDNGPAFTAAAQSLSATKGGTIVVPPGTYNFTNSWDLSQFAEGSIVTIEMSGATLKTTQPIAILKRVPADQSTALNVMVGAIFRIHGGLFQGNRTAGQIGIQLDATYGSVVDGVYLQNFDVGFDGAFDLMMKIENSRAYGNLTTAFKIESGVGSWSGATVNNSQSNDTTIENVRDAVDTGATSTFMILASDGVTIRNCISEGGNPTSNIYFDDQNSTTVKLFTVDNFHNENSPANAIITMRGRGTGTYTINQVFSQTADTLLDNNGMGVSRFVIKNIPWVPFTTAFKLSAGTGGVYGTSWHFENWGDGVSDITSSSLWQNGNVPNDLVNLIGGSAQSKDFYIGSPNSSASTDDGLWLTGNLAFNADNTYHLGRAGGYIFRPNTIDIGTGSSTIAGGLSIGTSTAPTAPLSVTGNALFSGNVGIGTTSPFTKLSVGGNTFLGGTLTATGTIAFPGLASGSVQCLHIDTSGNLTGTGSDCGSGGGSGTVSSGTQGQFAFYNAAGTTLTATSTLFLAQNGYLGIGSASPSYPLDVAGFINTDQYSGYKQAGNTVLYASSSNYATLVGISAGYALLSAGTNNTAIGYQALRVATSSWSNTAVGYRALYSSTSGSSNSAFGDSVLYNNTTGNNNVGMASALSGNTTGSNNVRHWPLYTTSRY